MKSNHLSDRIAELKKLIGEAYQIVGAMAHELWLTNIETELVLENLSQARRVHNNVLPFDATSPRIAGLERQNTALWADKELLDFLERYFDVRISVCTLSGKSSWNIAAVSGSSMNGNGWTLREALNDARKGGK